MIAVGIALVVLMILVIFWARSHPERNSKRMQAAALEAYKRDIEADQQR